MKRANWLSEQIILECESRRLAPLLELDSAPAGDWQPAELRAILRHQLSIPVETEPGPLPARSPGAAPPLSFLQLLEQPEPALASLRIVKDYAKSNRDHPRSLLPGPVATILYFAAIAAARLRCGARITTLDDLALRQGFEWAMAQDCVEEPLRQLFQDTLSLVPAVSVTHSRIP